MDNPEKLSTKNKILMIIVFIGVIATGVFVFIYKTQIEGHSDPESYIRSLNPESMYIFINTSCACLPIIDLRTPTEYNTGHINNSVNINYNGSTYDELVNQMNQYDKYSPIVLYCNGGSRSENASILLRDEGFKYIYTLLGGIDAWIAQGYPVET
jgi:rhodanese-related sulfurtransferase